MTKALPQPGEIYLHWKGTEYRVIGVAKTRKFTSLYVPDYWAKDSESQEIIEVFRFKSKLIMSLPFDYCPEDLSYVIYQQVNNLQKIWARKLEDFTGKVGNKERFEFLENIVDFKLSLQNELPKTCRT